jgi:hypothetical protein
MEVMERVRTVVASFVATILLSLPLVVSSATTCVGMPPLKPIHRICGVVFFPSGDRVHNAKATVLQGGKEIAVQETRDEGKFSFEQVKAGNYEIQVRVNGVPGVASTQVVLVYPESRTKREIAVNLSVSGVCSSFSLVNAKEFEAGLNPSDSS